MYVQSALYLNRSSGQKSIIHPIDKFGIGIGHTLIRGRYRGHISFCNWFPRPLVEDVALEKV